MDVTSVGSEPPYLSFYYSFQPFWNVIGTEGRRKTRVLLVAPTKSSFILHDARLLATAFDVRAVYLMGREQLGRRYLVDNVPNLLSLARGVRWADVVYSWFADFSYWPHRMAKMLSKRSIVVVGGYDVAAEPDFDYGALLSEKGRVRVTKVLNDADAVLPVDGGLCQDVAKNLGLDPSRYIVLPTGYDPDMFRPKGTKERSVLTISTGSSWARARIKGLDIFLDTARLIPHVDFDVVGPRGEGLERMKRLAPNNVRFHPPVPFDVTPSLFQRAKVYAQLSYREGLPNAVCESMLCECSIVGTDIPGIRSALGDVGQIVPYGDAKATAIAIERALHLDGGPGRQRIIENFSLERRRDGLVNIIEGMTNS